MENSASCQAHPLRLAFLAPLWICLRWIATALCPTSTRWITLSRLVTGRPPSQWDAQLRILWICITSAVVIPAQVYINIHPSIDWSFFPSKFNFLYFELGYLCRSAWSDDYDPHTKFVIVTPLHSPAAAGGGASRPSHEPQRRYCLTLTSSHNAPAKALSMTSSPQQQTQQQQVLAVTSGPSPPPVVTTGLLSQWEWIASSETCVRPYARYY